jgi:hypothetical protein
MTPFGEDEPLDEANLPPPPVSPRLLHTPLDLDSVGPLEDGSVLVPFDGSDTEFWMEGSFFTEEQYNLRPIISPKCPAELQKDYVEGCPLPYQTQMIILDHLSKLPIRKAEKMLFSDSMFRCIRHVLTHPKDDRLKTPAFREWCHSNFYVEGLGGVALICNKGDKRPLASRDQVHSLLCHAHIEADHGGRDRTSSEVCRRTIDELMTDEALLLPVAKRDCIGICQVLPNLPAQKDGELCIDARAAYRAVQGRSVSLLTTHG